MIYRAAGVIIEMHSAIFNHHMPILSCAKFALKNAIQAQIYNNDINFFKVGLHSMSK